MGTYENSWNAYTTGSILGITTGNLSKRTEATILSVLDVENTRAAASDRANVANELCISGTQTRPNQREIVEQRFFFLYVCIDAENNHRRSN